MYQHRFRVEEPCYGTIFHLLMRISMAATLSRPPGMAPTPMTPVAVPSKDHWPNRAASFDQLIGSREQKGETVKPSALAAFRLMTRSNFVGW